MAAVQSEASSGRVARRRARVRQQLLEAAEELIAERGVEGVTIEDITAAADIAPRSFYHHFDSKHDILVPLARERTKGLNRRIDELVDEIEDPAEMMATGMRHGFREIGRDPLCRWFVRNSGLPHARIYEGLADSGMRDAIRAVEAGRFHLANADIVKLLTSGAFIAVVGAQVDGALSDSDLDDAVEHLLRLFGLDKADAHDIAHRPLRKLPADPGTD